jgi:hypothetical protein
MIVELCKGGPHDGLKFEVIGDCIPLEWRSPSKFCSSKEVVYRPRVENLGVTQIDVISDLSTKEQIQIKFDFAGYEDSLIRK